MRPSSCSARSGRSGSLHLTVGAVLAIVVISAATIPAASAQRELQPTAAHGTTAIPRRWVGTWRLISETLIDQDGNAVGSLFNDAVGKLTYTRRGDVWALVGERTPSVSGAIWYTGTAKVHRKAGVVVHHVQYSSIAAWIDTKLVRSFKFLAGGARLNLSAEVTPELTDVLKWKKAGAGWAGPL